MEIKFLNKMGVPFAEVEAHKKIQKVFSNSTFSKNWLGFASFKLARKQKGGGDEDFDLVLITHTNIIVIELKNWHGEVLSSSNGNWYVDGKNRGQSPLKLVNEKARRLSSALKEKCKNVPFIASFVVIQDGISTFEISEDAEEMGLITLEEMLQWAEPTNYRKFFSNSTRFKVVDYFKQYDEFFSGPSCLPRDHTIEGFRVPELPNYVNPSLIYSEYIGTSRLDPNKSGLLRTWNFNANASEFLDEQKRAELVLKEKNIYEYVSDINDELVTSLLRPIGITDEIRIPADFTEVYSLPSRIQRLRDFKNKELKRLSSNEKIQIVKNLLNKFSELHKIQIAHKDVGENFIWLERSGRMVISGFPISEYPKHKIGNELHVLIEAHKNVKLEINHLEFTPYQKDVHALGNLVHLILFSKYPEQEFANSSDEEGLKYLNRFIEKSLSKDLLIKYPTAKEMLEDFNHATSVSEKDFPGLDKFDIYQASTKERDYKEDETFIDSEELLLFKDKGKKVSVSIWHGIHLSSIEKEFSLKLLSFLESARILKNGNINCLPKIIDFGLTRRKSLLLVSEWVDGLDLNRWLLSNPNRLSKLMVSKSVIEGLNELHKFGIPHGNINPQEIIVTSTERIKFTNAIVLEGKEQTYNYSPREIPENITPIQKDLYLTACIISQIFGFKLEDRTSKFSKDKIESSLGQILDNYLTISLEPLLKAIEIELSDFESTNNKIIRIRMQNPKFSGVFEQDNGQYHISIAVDKNKITNFLIRLTGIKHQINFILDLNKELSSDIWISDVESVNLNRSLTNRQGFLSTQINIEEYAVTDSTHLRHELINNPVIKNYIDLNTNVKKEIKSTNTSIIENSTSKVHNLETDIPTLWSNLLKAEEDVLPTLIVEEVSKNLSARDYQIIISCHNDNDILEFEQGEHVEIEYLDHNTKWRKLGDLNLKESSFGSSVELAVNSLNFKANIVIGDKLRLISTLAKYSFIRRSDAINKILANKAAIPNLIERENEMPLLRVISRFIV